MMTYRLNDDAQLDKLVEVTYWRVIHGLTQAKVGEKVGMTQTAVSLLLRSNKDEVDQIARRLTKHIV